MKKFYLREFLNPDEGVALVEAKVEPGDNWLNAGLTFGDCNRQVHLDFDCSGERSKDIDQMYHKLQRLEDAVKLFAKRYRAALRKMERNRE